jgi:hypothetical protein
MIEEYILKRTCYEEYGIGKLEVGADLNDVLQCIDNKYLYTRNPYFVSQRFAVPKKNVIIIKTKVYLSQEKEH